MNRLQVQLGFALILVALLTGLTVPFLANPRLGLAAHLAGITGGLVLVALGALAGSFALGARASTTMMAAWTFSAYGNWLACLLGGITGASRLTPIAGSGTTGSPLAEAVVAGLLQAVAVTALLGGGLAVWGFRARPAAEPLPATGAADSRVQAARGG